MDFNCCNWSQNLKGIKSCLHNVVFFSNDNCRYQELLWTKVGEPCLVKLQRHSSSVFHMLSLYGKVLGFCMKGIGTLTRITQSDLLSITAEGDSQGEVFDHSVRKCCPFWGGLYL